MLFIGNRLNWHQPNPRGEYVIPEPDVYRLIVKSTKPEAERFEKWVFEEVLPSIRKTGKYSLINATENYSDVDLRALSAAAHAASESALATAKANRILADTALALALANQYENHSSSETVISQAESQSQTKSQQALLPPRELAFIHAWSECLGSQTVTASDLYRAITAHQCQVLNDASGALLGDVAQWTSKKLSYALRRWSELELDDFVVVNMGKTSRRATAKSKTHKTFNSIVKNQANATDAPTFYSNNELRPQYFPLPPNATN